VLITSNERLKRAHCWVTYQLENDDDLGPLFIEYPEFPYMPFSEQNALVEAWFAAQPVEGVEEGMEEQVEEERGERAQDN
jgi:hypothetical protein